MHSPLEIVLLLHLDLPPGSDEAASDLAWKNCFEPLLGALYHTPDAVCGLVLTGELIAELRARHPEGIEWIRAMVDRAQIELVGGALYEPVLSSIPERDAIGQLRLQATQLRQVFGLRPQGAWLPHGMWEPSLPRVLTAAGMRWATVPDTLLTQSEGGPVDGIYRTEREGNCLALLPLETYTQANAGSVAVHHLVEHLKERGRSGHELVGIGLQASRFGLHPGLAPEADQTWLATYLKALSQARGELELRLPSQGIALGAPRGRVYLPSYTPPHMPQPWERTLVRYPSANRLHKKVLRVSKLVEKLDRYSHDDRAPIRPDPSVMEQARRYLYRAQTSAPYWHDPHGGVYDPALREQAWRDALRAEHIALQAMGAGQRLIVERADLDCDGCDEVLLFTPESSMAVGPGEGGALIELSMVKLARNLADVPDRIAEPYHSELPADSPLHALLRVDDRPRGLFLDRFPGPEVDVLALEAGRGQDCGSGYHDGLWEVVVAERHGTDAVRAVLNREGRVTTTSGEVARLKVQKRYTLRGTSLNFRQEMVNRSRCVLTGRHALQVDLPLRGRLFVNDKLVDSSGARRHGEVDRLRLEGDGVAVEVHMLQATELWTYPMRAVFRHLDAWRDDLQGMCLLLVQDLALGGGHKARIDCKVKVVT